jgi:hypothetical protein
MTKLIYMAEAAQSLALIPQNTFERQKFHEYVNLMRGQIQAGRNVYLSEAQEEQQIRSIAPLKPAPGIHAQNAITVLAFEPMPIDCEHLGICDDISASQRVVNEEEVASQTTLFTSEKELLAAKLTLYPNPSNGLFHIKGEQIQAQQINIMLFDIKGALLFEKQIEVTGSFNYTIDMSHLNKGIYFIRGIDKQYNTLLNQKIVLN